MKKARRETVSVIIPTKNRLTSLGLVLSSLESQSPAVNEIVVVDTGDAGSAKEIRRLVRSASGRYFSFPGASASSARNFGIAKSTGSILAFLDDDTIPEPGWTDSVLRAVRVGRFWFRGNVIDASARTGMIHAFYAFYKELTAADLHSRWSTYRSHRGYKLADLLQAGNFFVHRKTLEQIKPVFDEHTFPFLAEGTDLSMRIRQSGGQILFVPQASVRHLFLRLGFVNFVLTEPFWYGRAAAVFRKRSESVLVSYGPFGRSAWADMRRRSVRRTIGRIRDGTLLYRKHYAKNPVYDVLFMMCCGIFAASWSAGYIWGIAEYGVRPVHADFNNR